MYNLRNTMDIRNTIMSHLERKLDYGYYLSGDVIDTHYAHPSGRCVKMDKFIFIDKVITDILECDGVNPDLYRYNVTGLIKKNQEWVSFTVYHIASRMKVMTICLLPLYDLNDGEKYEIDALCDHLVEQSIHSPKPSDLDVHPEKMDGLPHDFFNRDKSYPLIHYLTYDDKMADA